MRVSYGISTSNLKKWGIEISYVIVFSWCSRWLFI